MARTTSQTIITDLQRQAEVAETERRRNFIERMEQKLHSKELAYAMRHGFIKDVAG